MPAAIERSTYVLFASLVLLLLFVGGSQFLTVVWQVTNPQIAAVLLSLGLVGWVIVFTSTFLINHFELFGLHQVANNLIGSRCRRCTSGHRALQSGAPSHLSRFHHRVLGDADDGRQDRRCLPR